MHILIAPNAFKNSLDAPDVAEAIQKGLQQSKLNCTCECFPIGDGGDGTAKLLIDKLGGRMVHTEVHDPLGRKINAAFGLIDKNTTVIEMADASGLRLLRPDELNPLRTSSSGTGELVISALDRHVNKIIMCIGGSATVDGGTGILEALGVRFLNAANNVLEGLPESLMQLAVIDISNLDKRIFNCEFIILCDVKNSLLGEKGAASVFGPQKGASENDVKKLEASLMIFRDVALAQTGKDMATLQHGGAAGGVAAGLSVFLNAKLVNGIDYFLDMTHFNAALEKADLVITGEGSIDEQTLDGKGPYGIARRAKKKNLPVAGLAGKIPLPIHSDLQEYFDVLLPIGNEPSDIKTAMEFTKENIIRTAFTMGNLLAL